MIGKPQERFAAILLVACCSQAPPILATSSTPPDARLTTSEAEEPSERKEAWSEVFVAPKGASSESEARTVQLSLHLPETAKIVKTTLHVKWCDEGGGWNPEIYMEPNDDCGWCRFVNLDTKPAADGQLITVVLKNWSHNRDRCGRIRAQYDLPSPQ